MQRLHMRAPGHWINDPNGLIYYKGQYHIFYQYFPYDTIWGRMHWGHAVSKDLIHYEHKDIALYPSCTEDQDGCFSGCSVEKDGRLHLFYTGVRYLDHAPKNTNCYGEKGFVAAQLLTTSEDGVTFPIQNKEVILPPFAPGEVGDAMNTRDPFVFSCEGSYLMLLGSVKEGQGALLFYKSEDLKNWSFQNIVSTPEMGTILECPNLFCIENEWYLMYSPMEYYEGENHAFVVKVSFDPATCELEFLEEPHLLDEGLLLYAPQTFLDENGRQTVLSWIRMEEPIDGAIGMFTIPRQFVVENGTLRTKPHENVMQFFDCELPVSKLTAPGQYRLQLSMKKGETLDLFGYEISMEAGRICFDRGRVMGHVLTEKTKAYVAIKEEEVSLNVFLDEHCIETYIGDGAAVVTHIVYEWQSALRLPEQKKVALFGIKEYI